MVETKTLQETVKEFVVCLLSEMKDHNKDDAAPAALIRELLRAIAQKYTTEAYEFNLAMDIFVEKAYIDPVPALESILSEYSPEQPKAQMDISFAAYYALSLIFKKETAVMALQNLVEAQAYKTLGGTYPLYFEVAARYYKRIGDYAQALEQDTLALDILEEDGLTNAAVGISYASTVSSMLSWKDPKLRAEHIAKAKRYVDNAIEANSHYPKYYFLRGQLTFLSAVYQKADLDTLTLAAEDAKKDIACAKRRLIKLYNNNSHYLEKEQRKYGDFIDYIDDILERRNQPIFPVSSEALEECRKNFLLQTRRDDCLGLCLPPLPRLDHNDKYFFICYCSADFKSVFSDMIELYKRKIPFRYDEALTSGERWEKQVEAYISDEDCLGVVFYLSKNTLHSNPVMKEIAITEKYGRPHFCVNLEGDNSPSHLLIEYLSAYYQSNGNYAMDCDQIIKFLTFFHDSDVCTRKPAGASPEDSSHIARFQMALMGKFPNLNIGD